MDKNFTGFDFLVKKPFYIEKVAKSEIERTQFHSSLYLKLVILKPHFLVN